MRDLWAAWRAGAAALRGPLVVLALVLAFVFGGVAARADGDDTPRVIHQPVIGDRSLDRLTDALEADTASRLVPPPVVAQSTASSVVAGVESGDIEVVPESATPPTSTTTSTSTSTTTSTLPPTTTTTDPVIRFEPHVP